MDLQLPISIKLNSKLIAQFSKLTSIASKLESQLNFQTMTAGWYGDEDNIINLCLSLESPESFQKSLSTNQELVINEFADDVLFTSNQPSHLQTCFIAITDIELNLLGQHPKLLPGFLDKKLTKVLNLIAKELNYVEI